MTRHTDGGGVLIGTSGWSYDHWDGIFYPSDLPESRRLEYYATRFPTVEINSTFYRLPTEAAVRGWRDAVPEGFRFAVKGSRFITHYHKLHGVEDEVDLFFDRMRTLGDAMAVVLWQLPPNMHANPGLLDRFLAGLPHEGLRHAVEFRHDSWLVDDVYAVLREHGAANVTVSSDTMPRDETATAEFVYVRLHGTEKYHGAYEHRALEPWADFLARRSRDGRDGYVFFNNDAEGHAPRDAERLMGMLGDMARPPIRAHAGAAAER